MVTVNEQLAEILGQTRTEKTNFDTAFHQVMETVGQRYGIYEAMTQTGPVTPQELAGFTNLSEAHIQMWLEAQASQGWLRYSAPANRYCLWCVLPYR
jgi:hypothetical protein